MTSKDFFSKNSSQYFQFRPQYPKELFDFLVSATPEKELAWDCATGNGQAAVPLASYFRRVFASDISQKQLEQAPRVSNITYEKILDFKTPLKKDSVDLVTVAQAFHWFNSDQFYSEVERVLKPEGILALWTYSLARINHDIDSVVDDFYNQRIASYWDSARKLVDEGYANISLSSKLREIKVPEFFMKQTWDGAHFLNYLRTWSAVQKFIEVNRVDPVNELSKMLEKIWPRDEKKTVIWSLSVRAFKR